jgi:hypothetical protein
MCPPVTIAQILGGAMSIEYIIIRYVMANSFSRTANATARSFTTKDNCMNGDSETAHFVISCFDVDDVTHGKLCKSHSFVGDII